MTVAVAKNLTTVTQAEVTTDWTLYNAGGGVTLDAYTDNKREGNACLGTIASQNTTDSTGAYYTAGASADIQNSRVYVWMNIGATIQSKAGGGARIIIGDGTNTRAYYVGGADSLGFQVGFWNCFVLDTANLPDGYEVIAGAAAPNLAAITVFGGSISAPNKAKGAPNIYIDVIRFGTGLKITGGTPSDPVTFAEITADDESLLADKAYGIIREAAAGVYAIQGDIIFGDATGSAGLHFYDTNIVTIVGAQPNQTGSGVPYKFEIVAGNSQSYFQLGNPVGIGNSQVGASPVQIRKATADTGSNLFTFISTDAQVTQSYNFGTTFAGLLSGSVGAIFATGSVGLAYSGSGVVFDQCGQIDMGTVPIRNSTFSGHSITGSGALIFTSITNAQFCAFRNNTDGTGSGSAGIQIPETGSFSFVEITFAGNDYDVINSSVGPVTISVSEGDTPTVFNTSGSSTQVINQVAVTLTGMVSQSEVIVLDVGTGAVIDQVEDVGPTGNWQFLDDAGNEVDIFIHAIDYVWMSLESYTIPSTATEIPIDQQFDRNYSNP
jgi:hypothetical protein